MDTCDRWFQGQSGTCSLQAPINGVGGSGAAYLQEVVFWLTSEPEAIGGEVQGFAQVLRAYRVGDLSPLIPLYAVTACVSEFLIIHRE